MKRLLEYKSTHNKKGYFALRAGRATFARPYLGRYANGEKMKSLIIFLIAIFSNACFAVGWEEVSKENIESRGISVDFEFDNSRGCNEIKVAFPQNLFFQNLGSRKFWGAQYREIDQKTRGWQLTSQGTQIELPVFAEENYARIEALCLSDNDLNRSYLSAIYGGPQGSPPMVVILKLGDYK